MMMNKDNLKQLLKTNKQKLKELKFLLQLYERNRNKVPLLYSYFILETKELIDETEITIMYLEKEI